MKAVSAVTVRHARLFAFPGPEGALEVTLVSEGEPTHPARRPPKVAVAAWTAMPPGCLTKRRRHDDG